MTVLEYRHATVAVLVHRDFSPSIRNFFAGKVFRRVSETVSDFLARWMRLM
jgi:hypothetical protein